MLMTQSYEKMSIITFYKSFFVGRLNNEINKMSNKRKKEA